MPARLRRPYGTGYLHFITFSCYQRRPLLGAPQGRDLFLCIFFLRILEETRIRCGMVVVGYVIMPALLTITSVHLLLSEADESNHSVVLQVLKQRFSRELLERLRERPARPEGSLWNTVLDRGQVWQRPLPQRLKPDLETWCLSQR